MDIWCSCRAPTEIRLIGTLGACRQFVSVQVIVLSPANSLILISLILRVVRRLQLAVFTRTLHSPIDSWSFHLESTWTPGGISLAGSPDKFLSISTWIPPGFLMESMDSTPFHITLHSSFHFPVDSTWTPAVLIIYFVGIGSLMKTKSHDGPKNK